MGEKPPLNAFESGLDHRLTPNERRVRATHRRLYREMVKNEIKDQPLNWLRRRALVRFAVRKLKIDSFEARLIIRAVEYECGHVPPAAMDEVESPVAVEYLPDTSAGQKHHWLADMLILSAAVVGIHLLLCLLR